MQVRSLLFVACVALATGACQTTSSDTAAATPDTGTSATIDPNRSTAQADETLHDRVHDALMEQMGPAVNDVGVTIHGTMVHLTGHVHSDADKQRAHDIAHGVSGVTAVDISALAVQP